MVYVEFTLSSQQPWPVVLSFLPLHPEEAVAQVRSRSVVELGFEPELYGSTLQTTVEQVVEQS